MDKQAQFFRKLEALTEIRRITSSRRYRTDDRVTLSPEFKVKGKTVSASEALEAIHKLARAATVPPQTHVYLVSYRYPMGGFSYGTPVDAVNRQEAAAFIKTENPGAEIIRVDRRAA